MDNLGSGTYETFERDPVKYERYEEVSMGKVACMSLNNNLA
jgi:hypothetical protein